MPNLAPIRIKSATDPCDQNSQSPKRINDSPPKEAAVDEQTERTMMAGAVTQNYYRGKIIQYPTQLVQENDNLAN